MTSQITFRPFTRADYELFARWVNTPHVARWWLDPLTMEEIARDYDESFAPGATFKGFIVLAGDREIGFIQYYTVDDEDPAEVAEMNMPGAIGIDYFIGDPDYIGNGYGSRMIPIFIDQIVRPTFPDATGVVADPEVANAASIRILEKAGFKRAEVVPGEYGPDRPEQLMKLKF